LLFMRCCGGSQVCDGGMAYLCAAVAGARCVMAYLCAAVAGATGVMAGWRIYALLWREPGV